jgi:hypothetical protein
LESNFSGSEHLKPGKLNISDVWDPNQNYPSEGGQPIQIEGQIKPVGKLNIKDLFQNQEENNNIQKPKVSILLKLFLKVIIATQFHPPPSPLKKGAPFIFDIQKTYNAKVIQVNRMTEYYGYYCTLFVL